MMSRRLISASKRSPVSMYSSMEDLCWSTMSAPVFSADMARTASPSSSTLWLPILSSWIPRMRLNSSPVRRVRPDCTAKRLSMWRISGWNRMITASTPTSNRAFRRAVIIRMPRADTTACNSRSATSTITILKTVESPRMLLISRKISRPTMKISRRSTQPKLRKPNMPSTFVIVCKYTQFSR